MKLIKIAIVTIFIAALANMAICTKCFLDVRKEQHNQTELYRSILDQLEQNGLTWDELKGE